LAGAYSQEQYSEPPAEFNKGVELFESGDQRGAIKMWQNAAAKDTNLAAAWFNMGIAYDMLRKDSAAVACYHRAAEMRPNDPDPWVYLAQLHRRKMQEYLAAVAYENAIRRRPDDPELLNGLAIVYDQLGEYAPALDAANRAVAMDSFFLSAWANKIIIHNHLNQFDSAAYYGEMVVAIFPDEPVTWAQIGLAYHYLGDDRKAIFAVDSSMAIFEGLAMAHYYRALILIGLGNTIEGIAEIAVAIELEPGYRETALQDKELVPIADLPEFKKIIGK